MKLSAYAQQIGVSYRTAWRWFKAGKLTGFQADTGTIIVTDPTPEKAQVVAPCK
jgi:putative resolvase